jgi:hypothetical protein
MIESKFFEVATSTLEARAGAAKATARIQEVALILVVEERWVTDVELIPEVGPWTLLTDA